MKNMKKILALLVAVLMIVASMSVAFAADPTGSITMADSNDDTVAAANKTFNAYKVLNVKISGTNYAYTIPNDAIKNALISQFGISTQGDTESDIAYEQRIVKAIEDAGKANVEDTAKKLLAVAKAAGVTADVINGTTTKSNLPLGYYVIEDATTGDGAKPVAAVALTTLDPNVTIKIKATKPPIDKNIRGTEDTDPQTTVERVKFNNTDIGDEVPYIVESTVPEMTGYTKYFFIVNDTLSKGLTFKETDSSVQNFQPITITVGTKTLTCDTSANHEGTGDFYYVVTPNAETGETGLKIVFKNFIQYKEQAGDGIVIKYSAIVNDDAVIGIAGNPNKVTLTYSDNPNVTPKGEKDEPHADDITSTTPEHKTKTFVTRIVLKKVNPSGDSLKGAEFTLAAATGSVTNIVFVDEVKFTPNDEGAYYKLTDGTYTTKAPSEIAADATNREELLARYVKNGDKYDRYDREIVKGTKVETKNGGTVTATSLDDGSVIFTGLSAGNYTITETKAPEGYNLLKDPININIGFTAPDTIEGNCTWTTTTTNATVDANGTILYSVLNQSGTELPSTGGMGTTILYIGGSILVILAAVLLITKRRMSADE